VTNPAFPDPEGFRVFHVDAQHITASVARPGVPFAELFFASARRASAFHAPRQMRGYVHDILTHGGFEIISPRTGQRLRSGSSLVLNDKSVFFGFPDEPDLLVAAGNLGQGFPICAAVVLSQRILISHDDPVWGIRRAHLAELHRLLPTSGWRPSWAAGPPILVSGDANFAHHAWNQLPCLMAALATGAAFNVLSTHEPLGPLPNLLPGLSSERVSRSPGSWLERSNAPNQLFVPAGSTLLTRAARDAILTHAWRTLSPAAAAVAAALDGAHRPLLWISLRTRNRTLANQIDVMASLCAAFLQRAPDGMVLLDGHSLPTDLESNAGSYDRAQVAELVRGDNASARHIIERTGRPDRVIAAIGLPICDTIALAQRAHFYFCHHGTVQHKIGWFSSAPGVVHTNRKITAARPENWVCDQSEIATRPRYIPETMIEDNESQPEDEKESSLRLENYAITDIGQCVATVLDAYGA
jgi:hypothetical protein